MVELPKLIHQEIRKESGKVELDIEKLQDLLNAYQTLRRYQWDFEEIDVNKLIDKLSDLDFEIMSYIGKNDSTSLGNIYRSLGKQRSTVSYRIERMIDINVLEKTPTIFKSKPLYLTDTGKKILSMVRNENTIDAE